MWNKDDEDSKFNIDRMQMERRTDGNIYFGKIRNRLLIVHISKVTLFDRKNR
jgi:hypothetical protein